ncbi:hypothetical protein M3Y97_00000200 [Aphelenchoides bicaudatus]|nr:hypothetical protein M3Y97_00000200 [Aphelenchoides bicaudatus]
MVADSFIDTGLRILPYVELVIGFPCIVCNIYFAFRFSQLSAINPNLRVLLILTNLLSAFIAILHPTMEFMPESMYSIVNGRYLGATLYYSIAFLTYAFVFILDCKFIMIMIERRIAFKNRAVYEQSDSALGLKIFCVFIIVAILVIVVRIIAIILARDPSQSVDDIMEIAFVAERSPAFFLNIHIAPVISSVLGVYELHRLIRLTKHYRHKGSTLSEASCKQCALNYKFRRFEINQTAEVIEILKPLLYIYCSLTSLSTVSYSCLLYFHYCLEYGTKSSLYLAITNLDYLCASSYTLLSTGYMLFSFRDMRRTLYRNFKQFLCVTVHTDRVCPEIDKDKQTKDHFDYLKAVWETKAPQ